MKLTDIHHNFETDKGSIHSYIEYYDKIFESKKSSCLNFLEIGVLFGGSLKMWHTYFANSTIYGVDDFSQPNGQHYYKFKPVNSNDVIKSLSIYERIKILKFDCESNHDIENNFKNTKFDIIIDDASHKISQQIKNLINYSKFLNSDGIYICEDIQTKTDGENLKSQAKLIYPHKNIELLEFNIRKIPDDRILVIK